MDGSKWGECSFLLELKPHSAFANLFVACPEGRSKEVVKILSERIEVGCLAEDNKELKNDGSKVYCTIAGIRIHPGTVGSMAWADNETLFTCRVKADPVHAIIDPKTTGQLAREVKCELKLDDFCTKARRSGGALKVRCAYCSEDLLAEGLSLTKVFPLPCDNWHEKAGPLEFFCCKDRGECREGGGAGTAEGAQNPAPASGQECLMSESHFLLQDKCTEGAVENSKGWILQCSHCLTEVGIVQTDNVYKFYHSQVELRLDETEEQAKNYLELRFGTLEKYFAWLLLSQCQGQASLKFVVRALDQTPRLLVWLLDSYSVMVRGFLSPASKADKSPDNSPEGKGKEGEEENGNSWAPFPALKILYKIYDDSTAAANDPKTSGQDFSIGNLVQPSNACLALTKILLQSSQTLPPACRAVGQFYVGFLKLSDSLT